jgi:hypothetical protein
LYVRPKQLHEQAKDHARAAAKHALASHEARLRGGDLPGVSLEPRRHAAKTNKIARSFERVAVPGDDG